MASDAWSRRVNVWRGAAGLTGLLVATSTVFAQAPREPSRPIFSCVDAGGKKITSDRPIPDCSNRDQRVLNPDGSVKSILPPTPTADERTEMEAKERAANAERVARNDAIRRDRNLLIRFPDEAAHNKAREKALDDIRNSVRVSKERIALLKAERKPLLDDAEFYVGKSLPSKLKLALDANDASLAAQDALIQNQEAEVVRINGLYDAELARLRKLWAGATPGSLGPLPSSGPPGRTRAER